MRLMRQMYNCIHDLHACHNVVKLCFIGDVALCNFRQTDRPNNINGAKRIIKMFINDSIWRIVIVTVIHLESPQARWSVCLCVMGKWRRYHTVTAFLHCYIGDLDVSPSLLVNVAQNMVHGFIVFTLRQQHLKSSGMNALLPICFGNYDANFWMNKPASFTWIVLMIVYNTVHGQW